MVGRGTGPVLSKPVSDSTSPSIGAYCESSKSMISNGSSGGSIGVEGVEGIEPQGGEDCGGRSVSSKAGSI